MILIYFLSTWTLYIYIHRYLNKYLLKSKQINLTVVSLERERERGKRGRVRKLSCKEESEAQRGKNAGKQRHGRGRRTIEWKM